MCFYVNSHAILRASFRKNGREVEGAKGLRVTVHPSGWSVGMPSSYEF